MQAPTKKKVFRIEQSFKKTLTAENITTNSSANMGDDAKHQEILDALHAIDSKLAHGVNPAEGGALITETPPAIQTEVVDDYKRQVIEATNLRRDLQELSDAIAQTKIEIASLRKDTTSEDKIHTASLELGAVVSDTEEATNRIIENAEAIDTLADRVRHMFNDEDGVLDDISERVVTIFEACNFQDITGQRITKVVNTMNFIDDRIHKMMDIWGGSDLFAGLESAAGAAVEEGDVMHGPALPDERINQDDIDALFD